MEKLTGLQQLPEAFGIHKVQHDTVGWDWLEWRSSPTVGKRWSADWDYIRELASESF